MVNKIEKPIVSWEAHEYIQYSKNVSWYIAIVVIGVAISVLSVLWQQWTFLALIIVSIIALFMYSLRPPRTVKYSLTKTGIKIADKVHDYSEFKSFGVIQDNGHFSIALIPRKRFSPRTTVYFPEDKGEIIVDTFGARLPMKEAKLDVIDKIVRFLRI